MDEGADLAVLYIYASMNLEDLANSAIYVQESNGRDPGSSRFP